MDIELDAPTARAAIALANRAPSVHNSQPWRWRIGPSTVHLFADPGRALPHTDPDGRDLVLSCGAALHHLRVALLAAGLGSVVHRLPDPAHAGHLAAVEVRPGRPMPDDLALARAIEVRRSARRVYSPWPVPSELLGVLVKAAADEGAQLRVLTLGSEKQAVAGLVARAAAEQSLTPGLAQEVAAWTGRARGAAEGVPAGNVPAGPGGTVPVRHFAGAAQRQVDLGTGEDDGTVVAVLSTEADGPVERLRAGEALSAVLLAATRIGLASDPISQPLEVPVTRAGLRDTVLAGQGEPQVLLRLGWAPISADPVPATGRRPVDETIDAYDSPWQ